MSTHFAMECKDANGRVTFSTDIRTVRAIRVLELPAGSTGFIPLAELPSGLEGVTFLPMLPLIKEDQSYSEELGDLYGQGGYPGDMPYTWVENDALCWRGGTMAVYMMVVDAVGLGGSSVIDER